jgi:signal peptidase II
LVGVAVLVILAVASSARDIGARSPWANGGLSLVLGGAIGNLIDRVRQGYVTDFVDLETPLRFLRDFRSGTWPDAALTVGVVLLVYSFLRAPHSPEKPVAPPAVVASEVE